MGCYLYHWNTRNRSETLKYERHCRLKGYKSQRNFKSKILLTQNTQDIWVTMKELKLRIMGIEEKEETQIKAQERFSTKS